MHDPHDRDWQTAGHIAKPREIPRVPETLLWSLRKDVRRASAAARQHPIGVELIIRIGEDLLWSEAFTVDRRAVMDDLAADTRRSFEARGWT